jgi:hypothetical protein
MECMNSPVQETTLMRKLCLALAFACLPIAAASARTPDRPVVAELFTSQGCSSCPPADAIVAELASRRPDLLLLTFHVTYWNSLGWQDPFSFAAATARQERYVALSVSPQVYTPAMVVDGVAVGADHVTIARAGDTLTIDVGAGTGHGTVLLLGYDSRHRTQVGRGENSGRTLLEANIVRSMTVAGDWTGQATHLTISAPAGEQVAVLVQADDGHILGAGRLARVAG